MPSFLCTDEERRILVEKWRVALPRMGISVIPWFWSLTVLLCQVNSKRRPEYGQTEAESTQRGEGEKYEWASGANESRESCGAKAESPQRCSRRGAANRDTSKLELSTKQRRSWFMQYDFGRLRTGITQNFSNFWITTAEFPVFYCSCCLPAQGCWQLLRLPALAAAQCVVNR